MRAMSERLIIEVVRADQIIASERVIFDRFGEVETVEQVEFRTPEDGWRRMRTDHPVRRKVGMPLCDETPVMRVIGEDSDE